MAWAITSHKSQGLTLTRATIDLGAKDFSPVLSFVAISRVKTLAGIAFQQLFGLGRLQKPMTESRKMLEDDMTHRAMLGFQLDTYNMDLSEYAFDP